MNLESLHINFFTYRPFSYLCSLIFHKCMELKRKGIGTHHIRKDLRNNSWLWEQNGLIQFFYLVTNWKITSGAGRIGFLGMAYSNRFHTAQLHSDHNKLQRPSSHVNSQKINKTQSTGPTFQPHQIFSQGFDESDLQANSLQRQHETARQKKHYKKKFL